MVQKLKLYSCIYIQLHIFGHRPTRAVQKLLLVCGFVYPGSVILSFCPLGGASVRNELLILKVCTRFPIGVSK